MSDDRLDQLDYYALLGLVREAQADAIRDAYHRFALKYHPDNHLGTTPERLARANQIFRRGAEAYRVLTDPEARVDYDRGLVAGRLRYSGEGTPAQGARRPPARQLEIKSRTALPFYKKAERAIASEDWQAARLNLQIALNHDPGNPLIEEKLAWVDDQRKAGKTR